MFGFGFAMIPFYEKICEVTGLDRKNDELQKLVGAKVDESRWVTVEFVANTAKDMSWQFEPLQSRIKVHPGEMALVFYRATNPTDKTIVGQAIPSYGPAQAGPYFNKLECFCFSQQTLKPREERRMPVQFVIAPDLPADMNTVTLSYTFFDINTPSGAINQAAARDSTGG
jgi:cytochrome c oxidase assembly protein subunit 11